jgi:hypothetical protein
MPLPEPPDVTHAAPTPELCMTTRIYGCSDDLIEFEGDVGGEVGHYDSDDNAPGALVALSDGTLLTVKYGKPGNLAIWAISVLRKGDLFDRIEECSDEEANPYSDQAFFRAGLKWAYVATRWERVK